MKSGFILKMKCNPLKIRRVRKKDCLNLWNLRNKPEVRRWFFNSDYIEYDSHKIWFESVLKKEQPIWIYVGESDESFVGVIRFEQKNKDYYVSVAVVPDYFGKGYGTELICLGTESFLKENKVKTILAEIIKNNKTSIKVFEKACYVFVKKKKDILLYKFPESIPQRLLG